MFSLQQLTKKGAALDFENNRQDVSGTPLVKGFFISNAEGMEDDARELAKKLEVIWIRVEMPKKWQGNPRWRISDKNLTEMPL